MKHYIAESERNWLFREAVIAFLTGGEKSTKETDEEYIASAAKAAEQLERINGSRKD